MDINRSKFTNRVAKVSLGLNLALLAIKLFAGIVARSTAMVADAVHSASDTAATLAVIIGLRVAGRPPDKNHPYGHAKAEAVAAKIVAVILTFTGFGLAWEAFHLLREGRAVLPGTAALWVGLGAIAVKIVLYRYVSKAAAKVRSSALDADAENHKSDILSTVVALLGIVGARFGYTWLDPLAGIAVGLLILKMAYGIYHKSISELMDSAPAAEITAKIQQAAQTTQGVVKVQETKARIHGPGVMVDMRLCVDGSISVEKGHAIAQHVVENVHQVESSVLNVLVHVNPCQDNAELQECSQCSPGIDPEEMALS